MYKGYIVEVKDLRVHNNADRLQIVKLFGTEVIVGLDVAMGDMMCYFPCDGRLGIEYCKANDLIRRKDENGNDAGGYLDERRKVGAIKLKGEKSDGLLMPLSSLQTFTDTTKLKPGDTIDILNGILICEKYIVTVKSIPSEKSIKNQGKKKSLLKTKIQYFAEHLDTSQYAFNKHVFKEGDNIQITLKLHGTSGRTGNMLVSTPKTQNKVINWIFDKLKIDKFKKEWKYVSGTRRTILNNGKESQNGFYSGTSFREKWHNFFVGKLHKGEEIFYEIIGYTDTGASIMSSCDNKKIKDKEFIKQYGKTTAFNYGLNSLYNDVYVYRINIVNEDGFVTEYSSSQIKRRCEQMGIKTVPELARLTLTNIEELDKIVEELSAGADPIGKSHIREGVVLRIENRNHFEVYKNKSFYFKVLESIIKLDDIPDMEDQS